MTFASCSQPTAIPLNSEQERLAILVWHLGADRQSRLALPKRTKVKIPKIRTAERPISHLASVPAIDN